MAWWSHQKSRFIPFSSLSPSARCFCSLHARKLAEPAPQMAFSKKRSAGSKTGVFRSYVVYYKSERTFLEVIRHLLLCHWPEWHLMPLLISWWMEDWLTPVLIHPKWLERDLTSLKRFIGLEWNETGLTRKLGNSCWVRKETHHSNGCLIFHYVDVLLLTKLFSQFGTFKLFPNFHY